MENTGLIDLRIKIRDYSKIFLTRNPFPAVGVPEDYPRITVDRDLIKKRFRNVISEILTTERTIITVMVGEYGSGKSHMLKVFKNSVNMQLLTSEKKALAIYVKSPGEDFADLFYSMVDDIGKDLLIEQARTFLLEKICANKEYERLIHDRNLHSKYMSGEASLDDTLARIEVITLFKKIRMKDFGEVKSSDVIFAFLNLARAEMSAKAWRWFLGQSLTRDDMKALGVGEQIASQNAYPTFLDFVKTLRVVGIRYLVILVDELEKITLLSASRRAKYQDQLRQMIDDNPKYVGFYFGIAPRQWEALTKEPTALVRRLSANWHVLDEFQISDTRELIEAYLFNARVSEYSREKIADVVPSCKPSLYPFTDEAIAAITKKSKGVVSNILVLARRALEILSDKSNGSQVVTAELIEKKIKPGLA